MDALGEFLQDVKERAQVRGKLLGLLHSLIGRRIEKADGTLISNGLTWRNLATELKKARWPREAVQELGLDLRDLPPRDRERFWYAAIVRAGVDSSQASEAGDRLAKALRPLGYLVGPAPGRSEQ
jgi:hypothetical protein